ncbi:hypothetical protein RclHR1_01640006 [Rhizophagus clarus]|uniref:Uncharacterized protein n=1 Tax=Rhizophagus clarus TaxID=94130 RepID=A0A2Z6QWM9_9GLOM|nr:hypothetical protein RclHR1_01640006 [Rhizophagus clarus]GES95488.1 hypothetical protein GLOIN_2v924068 [Rhizophagus clarus]
MSQLNNTYVNRISGRRRRTSRLNNTHVNQARGRRGTSRLNNTRVNRVRNRGGTSRSNNTYVNQGRVSRIRSINSTIGRIAQIITPQITDNPIENGFFNGTSFHDNNSFESLILPAGCSVTSTLFG